MSIPNPNPNIRDLEQLDNYTWSSNQIAKKISEASSIVHIDDTTASTTSVYSSKHVNDLLATKADKVSKNATLTHSASNTSFMFNRSGDFVQISVNKDTQVTLPTSWTSIGTLSTDFYTSGTGFITIPFSLVGGTTIDLRINRASGSCDIKANVSTAIWAQGLCVYLK